MGESIKAERASVLLAGRFPGLVEGIRGLLARRFGNVFIVADEASLLHGTERLQPDLVVVDLSLGARDVLGRIAEVRACAPHARVIALSVHDDATIVPATLAAGAVAVVLKHAIATDLMDAVETVLTGGNFVSAGIHSPTDTRAWQAGLPAPHG